ncbi:MAG: lytic transglycosylase domain-containing protein [Methylococcaceae bacterium]
MFLAIALLLGLPKFSLAAITVELSQEPPVTRQLLSNAVKLAKSARGQQALWLAAGQFCKAARLGSTEAQYQLGMLYAFGEGVPLKPNLAAALFSLAGQQGHYQAQSMLETMAMSSANLPACVLDPEQLPEKPQYASLAMANTLDIEKRIKHLPADKHWIIDLVKTMAPWYAVDPRLALSIISVESNFETTARSAKNAMGLMQLIPETAERFNVKDAFNASQNLKAGLQYLRWLLSRYQNDIALVAAGYNAGEGRVDQYHGVPPYPETQQYVAKVLGLYRSSQHAYPPARLQKQAEVKP